jgi:hypothetical protein
MSLIRLRARLITDPELELFAAGDNFAIDIPWAGSFNTETATYWDADGTNDTTRVWLTPAGRWVMTRKPWDCYITPEQARAWLTEHGHRDAAVEHIDRQYAGPGRPEVGPEVKFRVPTEVRDRVDELARVNGVTRADQLRTLVMDAILA